MEEVDTSSHFDRFEDECESFSKKVFWMNVIQFSKAILVCASFILLAFSTVILPSFLQGYFSF